MYRIKCDKPDWLIGDVTIQQEIFHNQEMEVFQGEVALDSVNGWIGNPRTELQAEQFKDNSGRFPDDDEMIKSL